MCATLQVKLSEYENSKTITTIKTPPPVITQNTPTTSNSCITIENSDYEILKMNLKMLQILFEATSATVNEAKAKITVFNSKGTS